MNLLTATSLTQGRRPSDFTWCVEGELVMPGIIICDRDEREGADGGCGCGRSWNGLWSRKSTTTAMVRDLPLFTYDDVAEAVRACLGQAGWLALTDDPESMTAGAFPAGTVLEIRLGDIAIREGRLDAR